MKVSIKLPKKFGKAAEESVKKALGALSAVARDQMVAAAQARMRGNAQDYIRGISTPVVTSTSAVITLTGRLANMMEKGTPPFDIKKMLRGRKFVDVPFRHGSPSAERNPMPKVTYSVMRQLAVSAKAGVTRAPKSLPGGSKVQGMMKSGAKGHRQYTTIRRISAKSKGWIHPGFKALDIFKEVGEQIRKLAPRVIADYIKNGLR